MFFFDYFIGEPHFFHKGREMFFYQIQFGIKRICQ
jgi:hypothetical protein